MRKKNSFIFSITNVNIIDKRSWAKCLEPGLLLFFFSWRETTKRTKKKRNAKKRIKSNQTKKKVRCLLYAANYILQPPLIPTNHYLNNKSWKYFRKREKKEKPKEKKCTKKWNEISRQSLSIIFIFFSSLHQWWKRLCSLFFLLLLLSPNKYMFWANLLLL